LGRRSDNLHESGLLDEDAQEKALISSLNGKATTLAQESSSSSIAADIDLDEHVSTISYTGQSTSSAHRNQSEDSFAMLPELNTIRPPAVNSIKDLKQAMFQSWDAYMAEGQAYFDGSLKRKEGAVVEAFVDGIYDRDKRRECETWLDERCWIWKNVRTFYDHLGIVKTQGAGLPDDKPEVVVQITNNEIEMKRAALPKDRPPQLTRLTQIAAEKIARLKGHGEVFLVEPRRSLRLVQKHSESQQPDTQQKIDRFGAETEKEKHKGKATELPPSYQVLSKPQQVIKKKSRPPIPKSILKKPELIVDKENAFLDALVTPPSRIWPQSLDERDPYSLPPLLANVVPKKPALAPPRVSIFLSKPDNLTGLNRKRKRDYKGHFVRTEGNEGFVLDDMGIAEPGAGIRTGVGEGNTETELLRLLEKTKTKANTEKTSTVLQVKKTKTWPLSQKVVKRPLKSRPNGTVAVGVRHLDAVEKGREVDKGELVLPGLHKKVGMGLVSESIERDEDIHAPGRATLAPAPKTMPATVKKIIVRKIREVQPKQFTMENGRKEGGWSGVGRRPPEIPILPSTPSDGEREW
jgi:hypothetical protein